MNGNALRHTVGGLTRTLPHGFARARFVCRLVWMFVLRLNCTRVIFIICNALYDSIVLDLRLILFFSLVPLVSLPKS